MAEAQLTELTELSPVPQGFIAHVADCTFYRHLEQFAVKLLGLNDVQYDHATNDAGHDSWKSCYNVLRIWYNRTERTVRDLRTMLKEAEARGFVEKGAQDLVLNGTQPAYLTSGIEPGKATSYPDLVNILSSWYKDPMWQNLNLFPWMGDEWALRLSEVYTRLEIESFTGKLHQRETKLLEDYRELFNDIQPEGTRILVKGDPGIGKTTFTRKVAYDWATGNSPQFDLVLVMKLKFSNKDQTIENMLVNQFQSLSDTPNPTFTESQVGNYLRSGKDRILLVLDGLDEIKLKEFPHVQKVLRGEAYRKCCILATTRPNVAETCHNKATSVAKILGFSREKAEEFTSYIISDESERKQCFQQIDTRNMSHMVSVPILVQALALLFRENKQLPDSLKTTYDELVWYLRKTCQDSKSLTEEEINAAMEEINELAFRGLMRDDKQLVFSRDEIKNENIMKLGLLAAEKSGSGRTPTIVLYFLHTTLQEYYAADYVTKELENGNRTPWEMLVLDLYMDMVREITQTWKLLAGDLENRTERVDGMVNISSEEPKLEQMKTNLMARTNQVGVVGSLIRTIEPRNALNITEFSEVGSVLRKIHPRFMNNDSPHTYASLLRKMNSLFTKNDLWLSRTPHLFKHFSAILKLLEKLSEPLFIFIMGKLPLYNLELITAEITEFIITASFDATKGSMLYLHNIRDGIEEFVKGKRPQSENTAIDEVLIKNPALIDFTAPFQDNYSHLESVARQPRFAALRVTGTGGEDDSDFLLNVNSILKTLSNIHSAELDELSFVEDGDVRSEFINALCQSSIGCLELFDLDPLITKELLEKLPTSVHYLSISQGSSEIIQQAPYRLLPAENLTMLSLENSVIDLSQASFPNLRQLIIHGVHVTSENNTSSLVESLSGMLKLEYLGMYHCAITSLGPSMVRLLQQSKLRHVILDDCNLSADDGEQILEAIQDGKLDHIRSLRLFGHKNLSGLEQIFKELCFKHLILPQISPETLFDIDNLIATNKLLTSASLSDFQEPNEDYLQGDHDVTSLKTFLTGIIQNQLKDSYCTCMTRYSNLTQEQWQTVITELTNIPPEQRQTIMMMTIIPNMTPENIQTMMTGLSNMTSEQIRTRITSVSNLPPELMQAGMTGLSDMTPEQIQTGMTISSNWTPELTRAAMTILRNMTPQQIQAEITGGSNLPPEQVQSMLTNVFNIIAPDEIQTAMTETSDMTPEEMQTVFTHFFNKIPEQVPTMITDTSSTTNSQMENSINEVEESENVSGATGTDSWLSQEPTTNDIAQTTDVFETPASCREQLEPQGNDAPQPQFDLLPVIGNTDNSANPSEAAESTEYSQHSNVQSDSVGRTSLSLTDVTPHRRDGITRYFSWCCCVRRRVWALRTDT